MDELWVQIFVTKTVSLKPYFLAKICNFVAFGFNVKQTNFGLDREIETLVIFAEMVNLTRQQNGDT